MTTLRTPYMMIEELEGGNLSAYMELWASTVAELPTADTPFEGNKVPAHGSNAYITETGEIYVYDGETEEWISSEGGSQTASTAATLNTAKAVTLDKAALSQAIPTDTEDDLSEVE